MGIGIRRCEQGDYKFVKIIEIVLLHQQPLNFTQMSDSKVKKTNKTSVWVAIGAIFLIILLIIWLTVADLTGDTDVAAFLGPYIMNRP